MSQPTKYHADIRFEDAEGGTWDAEHLFTAATVDEAIDQAIEEADSWFQSSPQSRAPVKADIALSDEDGDICQIDTAKDDNGPTIWMEREQ